jgi:hypothetical protein
MIRALRHAACLSLILVAACGPHPRPTTMREMSGNDSGVCFKHALPGSPGIHGEGTIEMYVNADGTIPAVWFRDGAVISSPTYYRCMTGFAVESKLETLGSDHRYLLDVTCDSSGCQIRPIGKVPDAAFDEQLAQATLTFSDWADGADKGWGYYYTRKYSDAQAAFEGQLAAHPDDLRAMRGLAQTLVETNGDMKKAREVAAKAVAQKSNAATLETLVRVCLKSGDDECAYENFVAATKAPDVKERAFDLALLNDQMKQVSARLTAAEKTKEDAAMKAASAAKAEHDAKLQKEDPLGCSKLAGAEQAKCAVKECFSAGASTYAKNLSAASKQAFAAGEMTAVPAAGGSFNVTIPIRTAAKKKDPYQDGIWTVVLGESMKAASPTASVISKEHNACK